jgi:hypothetical protein
VHQTPIVLATRRWKKISTIVLLSIFRPRLWSGYFAGGGLITPRSPTLARSHTLRYTTLHFCFCLHGRGQGRGATSETFVKDRPIGSDMPPHGGFEFWKNARCPLVNLTILPLWDCCGGFCASRFRCGGFCASRFRCGGLINLV